MIQHQARKGSHEFFLEGAFTGAVLSAGANDLGYPCIVGAGSAIRGGQERTERVGGNLVICASSDF
eukprot:scaffold97412_cov17-Tisochrysis_lutea.AAC.1